MVKQRGTPVNKQPTGDMHTTLTKRRHITHLHKLRAGLAVGHDEVSHRQQLVRHGTVVVVHCLGTLKVGGGLEVTARAKRVSSVSPQASIH